jgi:hypothetical protein
MASPAIPALDEHEMQRQAEREAERLRGVLVGVVSRLEKEAVDRVTKRRLVEQRWLEDLRQLHGEYEDKLKRDLEAAKRSTLFVNETRPKTNACEARLVDMLFPTDDKNWGIRPTPVPELSETAKRAMDAAQQRIGDANDAAAQADPSHIAVAAEAQVLADTAKQAQDTMEEARRRADAMSAEIDDQLTECRYAIQMRDVIRDACRIGTGVVKGPVANTDRVRKAWQVEQGQDGSTGYALAWQENARPAFYRVDPWSWFPEPDARTIEESADFFERHLYTEKDMRALGRRPGFDGDAVRRLLKAKATGAQPSYLADLRAITGENQAPTDGRYHVWEYRGALAAEEMRDLCACLGKDGMAEGMGEVDPLDEVGVVIWFCSAEILKFGLHHLDSGESIYSVYNLEKDDGSIWGFGIPYLMRDAQKAINGAWRMMMDNAGLSTGPQIEIDTTVVEPADGDWTLTPRKLWRRLSTAPAGKPGINTYDIPSHQAELAGIIQIAKQLVDDETSISQIAQGEQGSHTTQTANGMAILMNAVNVVFRRFVKNFDDDVTVPNIRRLYDWNMQFGTKEGIKGDFEVDARGSSVLLVREMQAQNLMVAANLTAHPVLGVLMKAAPILRKLFQSMMIPADEVVLSDEEIAEAAQKEQDAAGEGATDPRAEVEMAKLEAQRGQAQLDAQTRLKIAHINRETELIRLATTSQIDLAKLRAQLGMAIADQKHDERIFAAEVGFKSRQAARETAAPPPGAMPSGEPPAGTRFAP